MSIPRADRKLMREMNSTQVLQRIRANAPISRPELADLTGLSLSTISNIVGELLESHLIREVGEGDSTGGRRPSLLDINESARYAFGVKIGPETVWAGLFDLRGRQVARQELSFEKQAAPTDVLTAVHHMLREMRNAMRLRKSSILGIGVSTSGLIDANTGVCVYSPILGWSNVPVRDFLEDVTKVPVIVENDVNAFTYGALLSDSGTRANNMICITTGPGVGAGIVIERRLYRGSDGGAGEVGHMSIDKNGPICPCGRRGCLDMLGSDQYLVARVTELAKESSTPVIDSILRDGRLSPQTILLAAQVGDGTAIQVFRELGENLGLGIANLINVFNPDRIVLGGEGAVAATFFLDTLRETATQCAFPHLADRLEITVDDGSEDVWLQGAASFVIERFFEITLS